MSRAQPRGGGENFRKLKKFFGKRKGFLVKEGFKLLKEIFKGFKK